MKIPYEFLARWDHKTGALKGAYVKFYDTDTRIEGEAESVAVAGQKGFPLANMLSEIEKGALLRATELEAKIAELEAKIAELEAKSSLIQQ